MTEIEYIIEDIKNENCVVIVGPDILNLGQQSFFEALCAEIVTVAGSQKLIDTNLQYVFQNEELFEFVPNARHTALPRIIQKFYEKQTGFDEPFTKLSQIPFHLIISLMPDDRLQNIYKAQNLSFQYSHYAREDANEPVDRPTKSVPLLYNLLGDLKASDAIMTFDHLFTFLSGIMGKKELPKEIQEVLKKAQTFIFLGVHFEKWYVQLLLRIITASKEKKDKYTILRNSQNTDLCTFVARRLEVDFLVSDPLEFVDELYDSCRNEGLLKTISAKAEGSVFISYRSVDKEVAKQVEERFLAGGVRVIRDENSTYAGQNIEQFITTIRDVDAVFLIVSKDSLKSPWVSKEIATTLQSGKPFIPCYIDKSFLDDAFWEEVEGLIKEETINLTEKMVARGTDSIADLLSRRNLWVDMKQNLPQVRQKLTLDITKSIMPVDFNDSMEKAINLLISYAQR